MIRPKGFWKSETNRKEFLDIFTKKYQIEKYEDWKKISYHKIRRNGGGGLLKHYKWSWDKALQWYYKTDIELYSQKTILKKKRSYWDSIHHQQSYLINLYLKLQFKSLEEFRYLKHRVFQRNEGSGLLAHYKLNILQLISTAFPNYPWDINSFRDLKLYLCYLQKFLNIQQKEDWYRISFSLIQIFHKVLFDQTSKGSSFSPFLSFDLSQDTKQQLERIKLKAARKTLSRALKKVHSDQKWDIFELNNRTKKSMQYWVKTILSRYFSSHKILEDYLHPLFGATLELDIFLPALNIAFEYQGEQHYEDVSHYGSNESNKMRDHEKQRLCANADIRLVLIPYWWTSSLLPSSSFLNPFTLIENLLSTNKNDFDNENDNGSGGDDGDHGMIKQNGNVNKVEKREKSYWKNIENQREYMRDLIKRLKIEDINELVHVEKSIFYTYKGGASILSAYNGDLLLTLRSIFPHYPFDPSDHPPQKINNINNDLPHSGFSIIESQREFMEDLMKEVGVKSLGNLLYIQSREIIIRGGRKILKYHNNRRISMLSSLFPNYPWRSSHLDRTKQNLLAIQMHNHIRCKSDWYRLSSQLISSVPVEGDVGDDSEDVDQVPKKIRTTQHLFLALKEVYKNEKWFKEGKPKGLIGKKSSQKWLFLCIHNSFPNHEIFEDYLHPQLSFSLSGNPIQFDVFIPSLDLAFEYQGQQHFDDIPTCFAYREYYQSNDLEKRDICSQHNIKLITVPYWWDNLPSSLFCQYLFDLTK